MTHGLPRLVLSALLLSGAVVAAAAPSALSSSAHDSLETRLVSSLTAERGPQASAPVFASGGAGLVYYRSAVAALASSESDFGWQALTGQTFCIAEGHGAARLIEQRFAAHARYYPSSANALIGLKLGECQVVVEDLVLLEPLAKLPEWRRYARLLPRLADAERELMVESAEAGERDLLAEWARNGRLDQFIRESVDEVAFQAYVLADTLDCH